MVSRAEVTEKIKKAFAGVRRDNELTLHQAQLTDQGISRKISDTEWAAALAKDRETEWYEVNATAVDECDASLSHLSPIGWRFYLPAYMLRALELLDLPVHKSWMPGNVVHSMNLDIKRTDLMQYSLQRYELLSPAQIDAVAAFLSYVRDFEHEENYSREDASRALSKYWALPAKERPNSSLHPTATSGAPRRKRGG